MNNASYDIAEHEAANGLKARGQLLNALKNEAHVWLAFADRHSDRKLLAWYRELLSEEERERYNSFYFERDRHLYLLTHALARTTLSRYLEVAPDKWVFRYGPHGRPEIDLLEGNHRLRFSVSRTDGLVSCLIAQSIDAGVDVEKIRKLDSMETLFENVLTRSEISNLRDLPEPGRKETFFTFWTLKEAYIKARGAGLSMPLKGFGFHSDAAGRIRISIDGELQDIPSNWQFGSFRPTRSHAIAVALHREDRADLPIRLFEVMPQLNGSPFLYFKEEYGPENLRVPNIKSFHSKTPSPLAGEGRGEGV